MIGKPIKKKTTLAKTPNTAGDETHHRKVPSQRTRPLERRLRVPCNFLGLKGVVRKGLSTNKHKTQPTPGQQTKNFHENQRSYGVGSEKQSSVVSKEITIKRRCFY